MLMPVILVYLGLYLTECVTVSVGMSINLGLVVVALSVIWHVFMVLGVGSFYVDFFPLSSLLNTNSIELTSLASRFSFI